VAGTIVVLMLAAIVGLAEGRSQSMSAAPPIATLTPTTVPSPPPNQIDIVPSKNGNAEAYYLAASGATRSLSVSIGQRVTWRNTDTVSHTVVADNGAFTSPVLGPNDVFRWTPKHAGVYRYGDYLNPDIRATIIVAPNGIGVAHS
jgi:hypothetical protein